MCGRVIQSSGPLRYTIVDGMNVRDSRVHNYPPRWNAAPSQELLEPILKLPTAVDRITMSNDSAQGRAVGAHPGSFSGGENCRWTSWAQTDSDALCARSGTVDSQHRRAMAHAAAELPELQNCASALPDLVPR